MRKKITKLMTTILAATMLFSQPVAAASAGEFSASGTEAEEVQSESRPASVASRPALSRMGNSATIGSIHVPARDSARFSEQSRQRNSTARLEEEADDGFYYGILNNESEEVLYKAYKAAVEHPFGKELNLEQFSASGNVNKLSKYISSGQITVFTPPVKWTDKKLREYNTNAWYALVSDYPNDVRLQIVGARPLILMGDDGKVYFGVQDYLGRDYDDMQQQVDDKEAQILESVKASNEYTENDAVKELLVHDYVSGNMTYDYKCAAGANVKRTILGHTIYGAVVEENAVCDAISLMATVLLNGLDVDTYMLGSDTHAWNLVELDGEYYEFDCTWDLAESSEGGKVSYTFFNKTSKEINKLDPDGNHKRDSLFDAMPVANGTKYTYMYIWELLDEAGTSEHTPAGRVVIGGYTYNLGEADSALLISAPAGVTEVKIPETVSYKGSKYTVVGINDKAFMGNKKLKSVSIPETVYYIGSKAFCNCTSLKKIRIMNADYVVVFIGDKVFKNISPKAVFTISGTKKGYKLLADFIKSDGAKTATFKYQK